MTRTLPALVAAGLGALAALPAGANPPCVTHAPVTVGAPVVGPVTYSAPVYSAPAYHAPVYEAEKVYVPFAIPFAYFSFTAAPTTPPPVVVASPPPPAPVAAPAPAPCATACAAAHAPAAPPAVQAGTSAPPPSCSAAVEARLARLEGLLVRLGERQAGGQAGDDGPPPAREAGTTPVSVQTPAPTPPEPQPLPGVSADLGAVVSLLQNRCAQCHSGANARDGITLFNDRGEWQPNVAPGEVLASVRPRGGKPAKMPRGSPTPLSAEEVALVGRWAEGAK